MASKDPLFDLKRDMSKNYLINNKKIKEITELVLKGEKCTCERCECKVKKRLDKGNPN